VHQEEQVKHIRALQVRAEEVRAIASAVDDRECHAVLIRLADSYESMLKAAQNAYANGRRIDK
jgi:hypothetical protein